MGDEHFAMNIALVQLTQQMAMKSTQKVLMGFELMMYEQLCDFTKQYTELVRLALEQSKNEGFGKTEGGSS